MNRYVLALLIVFPLAATTVLGQTLTPPRQKEQVEINFADELSLETLTELISKKLNLNIIYDQSKLKGKRITLRAPDKIQNDQLISLLQSALRTHGMILVEDDAAGFRRIVDEADAANWASGNQDFEQVQRNFGAPTLGSATFVLKNLDPQSVKPLVDFLTGKDGSKVTVFEKQNAIAVTSRTDTLLKIRSMIEKIDVAKPVAAYNFYTAKNISSTDLTQKLSEFLATRLALPENKNAQLFDVPRTNQLAIIGPERLVAESLKLVERLDIPLNRSTKIFNLKYVNATRVQTLLENLTKDTVGKEFDAVVDEDANMLILTATDDILKTAQHLVTQLDVESQKEKSPVRFYRLKNISAVDALETIRALQGLSVGPTLGSSEIRGNRNRGTGFEGFPFNNNVPFNSLGTPAVPTGFGNGFNQNFQNGFGVPLGIQNRTSDLRPKQQVTQTSRVFQDNQVVPAAYQQVRPIPAQQLAPRDGAQRIPAQRLPTPGASVTSAPSNAGVTNLNSELFSPDRAQVTADPNTNSLIVIADEATQRVYDELIEKIDRRSPQVMIEAKIVTIDTSNQFSLGVEVSGGDRTGENLLFGFSQFGLSNVDPTNGALSLSGALSGFNGALIRPDVADVIINALSSHTRAKVVSSPRILVNENEEGVIESVVSQPFASTNASNTVATTSLGGNQEAGTTISVVPHISEGDHLELDFSIEFSAFQGAGTATLPPPRQISSIQSVATIPDGHTVIVGGLNREDHTGSVSAVPFLKDIPIIRDFAKSRSRTKLNSALFVFIRPIILRDDKFKNLRFLSRRADKNSGTEFPTSSPVIMK